MLLCSVYTCTGFEVKKGMNNIASFLLHWLDYNGYYSQSYGKNHKMPEISIIFDNCGGQSKNNVMIHFLDMIK